jgi:CO/xanthine dehydrogenase Mo-binding subunit/aerobic-type carbon monoxide dehydrogenase small subunit (CoxS/CutS family)
MAAKTRVCATINGEPVEFLCEPRQSLLECLRDVLGLTGTKEGCNDGNCGACSVLLNGRLVNACLVLGIEIDGQEVTTVEGLAGPGGLHPLQQAFLDHEALQCGYCTPGMLLAAKALLDREPNPPEAQIRAWLAGNLCRCTGYDRIVRAVQAGASALQEAAASLAHGGDAGPRAPEGERTSEGLQVVGSRPPMYGAVDRVTGRAVFGADVRLPGLIHGRVLRSPHAHARIRAIDTRAAEALPGVYAVVTARDLPHAAEGLADLGEVTVSLRHLCDNTLARDKVLYAGHPVAAVAAADPHLAEEALGLIRVDYEPLEPVLDVQAAMWEDAPLLHEDLRTESLAGVAPTPSNVASHVQFVKGDPERGLGEADVVVERTFTTATVHQGYLEPHASTANWSAVRRQRLLDGMLTVWTCTQGAFAVRDQLAQLLAHPLSGIRVIPTEVGGAFGGKATSYLDAVAALLALRAGRPVRLVMTRSEVLQATGPTSGTLIRVRLGATRDGRLTAATAELYYEAGAYPGSPVGSGADVIFAGYDIPNGRIDGYDVVVNKPKTGAYRGPGGTQANAAVEQVIDELAEVLGMDPLDLRLLNSAREGTRRVDGSVCGHIGARAVLEAARAHPHYRAPLEGPYRGRGVAYGYWGNWGGQSACTINVNADGTVALLTGSVDVSGSLTSIAMQAAEVLGLAMGQVRASVGDTDSIGYADVTGGSRTTFASGLAAVEAARDVIAQMRARAALLWDVHVDQVRFDHTGFTTDHDVAKRLTFRELAGQLAQTGGPVVGRGSVDGDQHGIGAAYAAHIADVEVDPETGAVRVLRYTAVQDVGRAVHPGSVEGQIKGGVVQGIGWALYEGCQYGEDGSLLNPTLLDNKLPTALDVPAVEAVIVEVPNPHHPYGVRGVGEAPIIPPPAAIANAVSRAIGRRLERLPLTPAYILERMEVI